MAKNQATTEAQQILRWRHDPVAFVRECFNLEPDEWQKDFLIAYNTGNRTAAKACKGPGKTAVLAWCAWHYLATRGFPKVIATSITGDNLRDGLWSEMAKWQYKSNLLKRAFRWQAERITSTEHAETWYMSARRWSRDSDSEKQGQALAGLHADNILFIIDEAGGVPDAVMAAAEAALANAGTEVNPDAEAKLLICGNPTHLSGPLYRACTSEASLWTVIEITGDPDDPKRSKRINVQWARDQIKKYGADNPWVLVNVFGKFPPSSINALLGPDEVEEAMSRVIPINVYSREPKILGVDVALGGGDPTVIMPRQGLVYFRPKIIRSDDPRVIAGVIGVACQKWGADMIFIDNTGGYGSGVLSYLQDWGYPVTGVKFSQKATDPVYYNKRTEMIHDFSYHVKAGACLARSSEFKEAICAQTYVHKRDQMIMQPKDQLKEGVNDTTGFDILDASALTHAYPVARRMLEDVKYGAEHNQKTEYSPVEREYGHADAQQTLDDYNPVG